jgi:TrpR-related protein YerC/YecD
MQAGGEMDKIKGIDKLIAAFLALETQEECLKFLEDVCTIKEIEDMCHRLEIADLLYKGKTFNEIADEISASSTTISRVNKSLKYGGGYKLLLDKLYKQEECE